MCGKEAQPLEDLKQPQLKETFYGAHFGGKSGIFGAPSGLTKPL